MAFDLFFDTPTFDISQVMTLKGFRWYGLPEKIAHYVAVEEQSLHFNIMMLEKARHTKAGSYPRHIPYSHQLGLTLRATFVKSIVVQGASIVEAVLRHIAETRGYKLPKKNQHRTMGTVLKAWSDKSGSPKPELASHWDLIKKIHEVRNNIHIFKAVDDPNSTVDSILESEEDLIPKIRPLLDYMSSLLASTLLSTGSSSNVPPPLPVPPPAPVPVPPPAPVPVPPPAPVPVPPPAPVPVPPPAPVPPPSAN